MAQMMAPGGWVKNPAEVERVMATLTTPEIKGDHPIRGSWDRKTSHVLWDAEIAVLGSIQPSWKQVYGTCVSYGNGRGANDTLLCDLAIRKEPEEYAGAPVATEPLYALSRVEIGGGRISGDGSVGAWAAKALMEFGVLFRKQYTSGSNSVDLTRPNDDLARKWGAPRAGLPDWLEPITREHPVKDVALVSDVEDAADLIASYYPVAPCSGVGFTMKRDRDGFCRRSGSWAHCMLFRGVVNTKLGPALACQNSWGDYLGGTMTIEDANGREITLPEGCFLVDFATAQRMLGERDSFVLAGAVGMPRRSIDWTFA